MTDAGSDDQSFSDEALPHLAAVHRFALRLTQEPDAAEDLVQETFLRAYLNWDKYVSGTQAKKWLFTICRNLFLRADKRAKRHRQIVSAESGGATDGTSGVGTVFALMGDRDPEGKFWSQVIDKEILRAVEALPEEYREVVILSDLEDLAYEEIAGVLDIPIGTVKSRLFRGRRILQEELYAYAVESGIIPPERPSIGHDGEGREK